MSARFGPDDMMVSSAFSFIPLMSKSHDDSNWDSLMFYYTLPVLFLKKYIYILHIFVYITSLTCFTTHRLDDMLHDCLLTINRTIQCIFKNKKAN